MLTIMCFIMIRNTTLLFSIKVATRVFLFSIMSLLHRIPLIFSKVLIAVTMIFSWEMCGRERAVAFNRMGFLIWKNGRSRRDMIVTMEKFPVHHSVNNCFPCGHV